MKKSGNRYNASDLSQFREIIEKKLERTKYDLEYYQQQILEMADILDEDQEDWPDGPAMVADLNSLNDMALRLRKYIQDLNAALLRIRNGTYGICVITGEQIDKRRLIATPTTTKSIAAKEAIHTGTGPHKKKPPVHDTD